MLALVACGSDSTTNDDGGTGTDGGGGTDSSMTTDTGMTMMDTGVDTGVCTMTKCGNACVDTMKDDQNCGMCGNACTAMTSHCTNGICCATAETNCNGKCVDLQADTQNCGMCGKTCSGNTPACINGMCAALPTFVGPKISFPESQLSGWSLCYKDLYSDSGSSLANKVLTQCSQAKLMLACRKTGDSTIIVAAHAPRADVIFATGSGNTGHDANGSTWYYDTQSSWGFVKQGDALDRLDGDGNPQCDTGSAVNPAQRLCWNAGSSLLTAGWRCGSTQNLNASGLYERLIYQAP